MDQSWKKLQCSCTELQLDPTLSGGQCFRWRKYNKTWTGVIGNSVWRILQDENHLFYKKSSPPSRKNRKSEHRPAIKRKSNGQKVTEIDGDMQDQMTLKSYFRLEVDLKSLYNQWANADTYFKQLVGKFYGIRILNQDVAENLFSFICSSNNHIHRISWMVEKLCSMYGTKIETIENKDYYNFPNLEKLALPEVEQELRAAGFGYRAKFIQKSASLILENGGSVWLDKLRTLPYQEAKTELMKLPGIGAKVADCICLMSLGHMEAVPVDTHVFQIASQRYLPHLRSCKSVTNKVYNEIGEYFRNLYGDQAGWAHTILFCADLKMFQENSNKKVKKSKKTK